MSFILDMFTGGDRGADYQGLSAEEQERLITRQAEVNRVPFYTPFGNLEFEGENKDIARINLTPAQQYLMDIAIHRASASASGDSEQGRILQDLAVHEAYNRPATPDFAGTRDTLFDASMSRLRPEFDRRRQQLQTQLNLRGIPGSGADLAPSAVSELDILGRQENDAMMRAFAAATGQASDIRAQDIASTNALQQQMISNALQIRQGDVGIQNALQQQGINNALALSGGQLLGIRPSGVDVLGVSQLSQNAALASQQAGLSRQASTNALLGMLGSAAIGAF